MTMPFYISPEQAMRDRAEYARAGIAKGRSVAAISCREGICLVADNPSGSLHKISEIYDRLGFAAAGRYNEFESLRIAGIRHADLRGYQYARSDVTGRSLANAYSQLLGAIFAGGAEKPYEVDLILAELDSGSGVDQLFRVSFDGSILDFSDVCVVGGNAAEVTGKIQAGYSADLSFSEAIELATNCLSSGEATSWEVAVLDRSLSGRTFCRVKVEDL